MKKLLFPLFFTSVASFQLWAQEPAVVKFETQFNETSDQLILQRTALEYYSHRRDILWSYPGAQEEALDYGVRLRSLGGEFADENIQGLNPELFLGKKWSFDKYTGLYLGAHNFSYGDIDVKHGTYELFHTQKFKTFDIRVSTKRNMYYLVRSVVDPLADGLSYENHAVTGSYAPIENWRVLFGADWSSISDGNSANQQKLSLLYGRVYPTWIWVGYGFEKLNYQDEDVNYWSPEDFLSHGPQIEFSRTFLEKFEVGFSYSYSAIKEGDFDEGTSTYGTFKLQYGDRNKWFAGVQLYDNESEQASTQWRGQGTKFFYQKSL